MVQWIWLSKTFFKKIKQNGEVLWCFPSVNIYCFSKKRMLTYYFQIADLTQHRISIYLAHIPSPIRLSDFADMKEPKSVIAMCDSDAMIFCNDVRGNR